MTLYPALKPKNGRILEALGIARISTVNQDERSLKDQEALLRRWLNQYYGTKYRLTMIASQGSGERLDREKVLRAYAEVETGKYDLVITESISRINRRVRGLLFAELCQDCDTRLIAIIEQIDTARSDWKISAWFSALASGNILRRSRQVSTHSASKPKSPPNR